MDNRFSQFAGRLKPSAIRSLTKAAYGKNVISFAGGLPHPDAFPDAELAAIAAEVLGSQARDALQYGLTQGYPPLIEKVIAYLATRGVSGLKHENVLIAAGSQQALDLVGRIFIDPGDVVLVETPGYVGALAAFENLGARLKGIPVLEDGPDLDRLESALKKAQKEQKAQEKPRFFYFTPNFANPTGVLTSPEKRRAVYELARQYDLWIVEDDAYGEIYFAEASPQEVEPMKAADPDGRVIYLQTFSKTIAPGLRVAAMAGPAAAISLVEMAKQTADMFTGGLTQRLAFEFLRRGKFTARLPDLRALYQRKRDAMVEALGKFLPEGRWGTPKGGFFVWLELPGGLDACELLGPVMEAGVVYVPGPPFWTAPDAGAVGQAFRPVRGSIGEALQRAGPKACPTTTSADSAARLAYSRETEGDITRGIEVLGAVVSKALEGKALGVGAREGSRAGRI